MPSFSLSLNPIQSEILLKPGASFIQAYTVTNNSDSTILVNSFVKPWIPQGITGQVDYLHALPNPNLQFSLQNTNLALNQPFYLKPSEKKQLVLKITTSNSLAENDSYYTFFVSQDLASSNITTGQNQNSLFGSIGTHLLITTSNIESPHFSATISNFIIKPQFKDCFFGNLDIAADINNNSPYFFKTPLTINLTKNNRQVISTTLEPQNVLANYSRHFQTSLKPPFWPGFYTATATLPQEFGSVSATSTFYVFPYSLTAIIILIAIIALIIKKIAR
jgi:hypothetical protein